MPDAGVPRSVAITGASGFLGQHLTRRMTADGWAVHAMVLPQDQGDLASVGGELTIHTLDGSTETVCGIIEQARPLAVLHLASLVLAEHRVADVAALIAANVLFGTQLLEGMRAAGCRNLVNVGTSWQHRSGNGYDPVCLYAATKQAFEDISAYYVSAAGLRMVTLKLYDNYGPQDARRKLVANLVEATWSGRRLALSPGLQLLDLVYVDDVVAALLNALARLLAADEADDAGSAAAFAVSAGRRVSVRELVAIFQEVSGQTLDIEWGGRPYRSREVMVPWSSGRPLPGWSPRIDLRDGLTRTLRAAGL